MSSRSGTNVRAKRTTAAPAEYVRPTPGAGPVTSHQVFNTGANTTGMNARINGPNNSTTTKNVSNQQQQQYSSQPTDIYNPPAGSKLTIGNAVALITLRLGRLETFMNQYQLEEPRVEDGSKNEIIQMVLSRISALEQKTGTFSDSKSVGTTDINQSVLNRVIALEKNSEAHYANYRNVSEGLKNVETTVQNLLVAPAVNENGEQSSSFRDRFDNFAEELRETKDLLLKLQSFTMETNTKLVNTIFSQVDQFEIQEFDNELNDNVCDSTFGENDLEEMEENVDENASETKTEGIRVNFKELISQELLGIGSS